MAYLLGFVLGVLLVLAIWWLMRKVQGSSSVPNPSPQAGQGSIINAEQVKQRQEHLDKVLQYIAEHDRVTNNDVEKLLNVSNATAERYLNELEKQGKVVQVGTTGQNVFYKPK